ncbi:hypothetical protein [Leptospira bandrabouensis]|uniref:Lipoprotein n=1 Tax=Leptospira bandrabouensis TaxID=2484903 RepID=A0A6H3NSE9_9LEPT|nr:hypothetical protein [Leptospira bandrabouensis]TGN06726.1 hypothetical protein EHR07_07155 [Leptospira bandrabouensis]TGN13625.1 hypothetical protein EHR08_10940 [Leptospira bandrabouensis]
MNQKKVGIVAFFMLISALFACDKKNSEIEIKPMTKAILDSFQDKDEKRLSELLADKVYFQVVEMENVFSKPKAGWYTSPAMKYILDTKSFRKSFNLDEISKETGYLKDAYSIRDIFILQANSIKECYKGCNKIVYEIEGKNYPAGILTAEYESLKYAIFMFCLNSNECRILRIQVDFK